MRGSIKRFKASGRRLDEEDEWKTVDLSQTVLYATEATPQRLLLNNTLMGEDFMQRIGKRIVMRRLTIKWFFDLPDAAFAAAVTNPKYRMIIVYDRTADAAAGSSFAVNNLLEDFPLTGPPDADTNFLSFPNPQYSSRFLILKDWWFQLPSTGGKPQLSQAICSTATTLSQDCLCGELTVDLKGLETIFNTRNGVPFPAKQDIETGVLWWFIWSTDLSASPARAYDVSVSWRLWFTD